MTAIIIPFPAPFREPPEPTHSFVTALPEKYIYDEGEYLIAPVGEKNGEMFYEFVPLTRIGDRS